MIDPAAVKLGKLAPRFDTRTLKLARYAEMVPVPPAVSDWAANLVDPGMMLNNDIGICTCAAAAHMIQVWTAANGQQVTVPDADVLTAYRAVSGYDPDDASTDIGAVEIDVLNYWRKVGIGGHRIYAYAALEPRNREHIKIAVHLFGGAYIGAALPKTIEDQDVWRVAFGAPSTRSAPGTLGGHAVNVIGYDVNGVTIITWGQIMRVTWTWFDSYTDEAYAVLSEDWADRDGTPHGLDLAQLASDLKAVST